VNNLVDSAIRRNMVSPRKKSSDSSRPGREAEVAVFSVVIKPGLAVGIPPRYRKKRKFNHLLPIKRYGFSGNSSMAFIGGIESV